MFPPRPRLSAGERQFYIAAAMMALMGAILACTITIRLSARGTDLVALDPFTLWTVLAGAAGGLAGFLGTYSRWFGHPGSAGWLKAMAGGLILSLVGSVVAGTMILPYYGTMFGPFQMIIVMIAYPGLGLAWIVALALGHRLMMPWQDERDSIFRIRYTEPLV